MSEPSRNFQPAARAESLVSSSIYRTRRSPAVASNLAKITAPWQSGNCGDETLLRSLCQRGNRRCACEAIDFLRWRNLQDQRVDLFRVVSSIADPPQVALARLENRPP
jgi:hypothetical protein